jgi:hypothetical protein
MDVFHSVVGVLVIVEMKKPVILFLVLGIVGGEGRGKKGEEQKEQKKSGWFHGSFFIIGIFARASHTSRATSSVFPEASMISTLTPRSSQRGKRAR